MHCNDGWMHVIWINSPQFCLYFMESPQHCFLYIIIRLLLLLLLSSSSSSSSTWWKLWHCSACWGYFVASIVHQTLTWTSGSLTCICDLFHMRVCTEFDSGEISGRAQSPAHNGHPSIWWSRSIVLNFGFWEWVKYSCSAQLSLLLLLLLLHRTLMSSTN